MRTRTWATAWSALRLVMAVIITAAIVTQLVASIKTTAEGGRDVGTVVANFFSFFTILSNVIAAGVLGVAGARGLRGHSDAAPEPAGLATALACATTYMIITGVVYNLLLRGYTLPQGSEPVPWSNEVLHLIGPLFLLVDLFVGPYRRALRRRTALLILIFPLIWTAYTLVRGPLVTNPIDGTPYWYPYPFLNPNNPGGWGTVLLYVVIISVSFVVVGALTVWVGRRRGAEPAR